MILIEKFDAYSLQGYNVKQVVLLQQLFDKYKIALGKLEDKIIKFLGKDYFDIVNKLKRIPSFEEFEKYILSKHTVKELKEAYLLLVSKHHKKI